MGTRLMRKELSRRSLDDPLLKHVTLIEQSGAFMDRLINALLDVERIAQGKLRLEPQEVDLRLLLQECVDLFSPIVASKSFTMTVDVGLERRCLVRSRSNAPGALEPDRERTQVHP